MRESHKPFLELVLNSIRDPTYTERYIREFLEGEHEDHLLSKAFEIWSAQNSGGAQDLISGKLTLKQCQGKTTMELGHIKGKEPEAEEISATV